MSSKFKVYCSILQYLSHNKPELAQLIEDYCLRGALNPRGGRGITFIIPSEKVLKRLKESRFDENPEYDLLKAHILTDIFTSSKDFDTSKNDKFVVNKLGKTVAVTKTSGSQVVLQGGVIIKPRDDFRCTSNDKLAVWEVVSGELDTSGEKFSPVRGIKPKSGVGGGIFGGGMWGGSDGGTLRELREVVLERQTAFVNETKSNRAHNTFATACALIIAKLEAEKDDNNMNDEYRKRYEIAMARRGVFPELTFFEWTSHDGIIPNDASFIRDLINEIKSGAYGKFTIQNYRNLSDRYASMLDGSSPSFIYTARSSFIDQYVHEGPRVADSIRQAYAQICQNNGMMDDVQVYPAALCDSSVYGQNLADYDFRNYQHAHKMYEFYKTCHANQAAYNINTLRSIANEYPINGPPRGLKIAHSSALDEFSRSGFVFCVVFENSPDPADADISESYLKISGIFSMRRKAIGGGCSCSDSRVKGVMRSYMGDASDDE